MAAKEIERSGSSSLSDPSDGSDPNPCPICLGPLVRVSYLDTCFHKFCYNCIVQWTKVVAGKHSHPPSSMKCPLCKTENFSIIHGYDGVSFERHYIDQNRILRDGFVLSKEHRFRLQCYYTEPGLLNDVFDVSRFWKMRKYLQPNRWLETWLKRELQALLQEGDVDIILHHLLGVIDSFSKRSKSRRDSRTLEAKQEEFRAIVSDAARPFIMARTDRFVDELELFLASGLNAEAYDAVYKQRLGWSNPRGVVEVVDEEEQNHRTPGVSPYLFIFDVDSDDAD